jgi:hypothetical protein
VGLRQARDTLLAPAQRLQYINTDSHDKFVKAEASAEKADAARHGGRKREDGGAPYWRLKTHRH